MWKIFLDSGVHGVVSLYSTRRENLGNVMGQSRSVCLYWNCCPVLHVLYYCLYLTFVLIPVLTRVIGSRKHENRLNRAMRLNFKNFKLMLSVYSWLYLEGLLYITTNIFPGKKFRLLNCDIFLQRIMRQMFTAFLLLFEAPSPLVLLRLVFDYWVFTSGIEYQSFVALTTILPLFVICNITYALNLDFNILLYFLLFPPRRLSFIIMNFTWKVMNISSIFYFSHVLKT